MVTASPENVMGRTRTENATWVIERLRDLDFDPNASSRLMKMQRVLSRGLVPFEDPDFFTALEAEHDMQQLAFILDRLIAHRDDAGFRALVTHVLSDSALPQDDREESPGRDAQFHLYLAAICQNAGLAPVTFDEPDVTCVVEGTTFAIAAKRMKDMSRLEKRVRKAAKQIMKVNLPGIIAVELSIAMNRDNTPLISPLVNSMFDMFIQARGNYIFDNHHQSIYKWVAGKGVRGVVVFDFTKRLRSNDQWGLDGAMHWLPTAYDNERAYQEYEAFNGSFLKGVPNLKHL